MQSIRGLRSRVAENRSLADRSFAAPPPPPHDRGRLCNNKFVMGENI
jgi:hypothetical protein